mmetsp:Transcript_15935/g.40846  ORF Transcript_15935/g.40846 Transcript_15935/m.40846 type:complete len:234 (+) Transcript_15935:1392-2093(+)
MTDRLVVSTTTTSPCSLANQISCMEMRYTADTILKAATAPPRRSISFWMYSAFCTPLLLWPLLLLWTPELCIAQLPLLPKPLPLPRTSTLKLFSSDGLAVPLWLCMPCFRMSCLMVTVGVSSSTSSSSGNVSRALASSNSLPMLVLQVSSWLNSSILKFTFGFEHLRSAYAPSIIVTMDLKLGRSPGDCSQHRLMRVLMDRLSDAGVGRSLPDMMSALMAVNNGTLSSPTTLE